MILLTLNANFCVIIPGISRIMRDKTGLFSVLKIVKINFNRPDIQSIIYTFTLSFYCHIKQVIFSVYLFNMTVKQVFTLSSISNDFMTEVNLNFLIC